MAVRRSEYLIGTTADWAASNPILAAGQVGIEVPSNNQRIGDGVSRWSTLPIDFPGEGGGGGGGADDADLDAIRDSITQLGSAVTTAIVDEVRLRSNGDEALQAALDDLAQKVVDWGDIANMPTEFPSTPHSHVIEDVTDLDGILDAKADLVTGRVPLAQLPILVLAAADPIPAGTPTGTIIIRKA